MAKIRRSKTNNTHFMDIPKPSDSCKKRFKIQNILLKVEDGDTIWLR